MYRACSFHLVPLLYIQVVRAHFWGRREPHSASLRPRYCEVHAHAGLFAVADRDPNLDLALN